MMSYHLRISCCACGFTNSHFSMSVRICFVSNIGMLEYMFVMSNEAREWHGTSGVSLRFCISSWVFLILLHIHTEAATNNHLNEGHTIHPNAISDTLLRTRRYKTHPTLSPQQLTAHAPQHSVHHHTRVDKPVITLRNTTQQYPPLPISYPLPNNRPTVRNIKK